MKLPQLASVSASLPFQIKSAFMRVTDPCYDLKTWCAGQVPALNGGWTGFVGYFKDPQEAIWHEEHIAKMQKDAEEEDRKWKERGYPTDTLASSWRMTQVAKAKEDWKKYPGRVAFLHVQHDSVTTPPYPVDLKEYELVPDLDVGVDSGQAGFFDLVEYTTVLSDKGAKRKPDSNFERFYSQVCDLTCGDTSFGTVPFGIACSSGYGDGGYDLYVRKNSDGLVIAAIIVFISADDEEQEEAAETQAA